jgi:hypothetical protein
VSVRLRAAAALLVLALPACSAGADPEPGPSQVEGLTGVATFPDQTREHVERRIDYPQTPPVGGDHWPPQTPYGYGWQRCAVYTEPVVDEFAVHSLEHGAVWLSYRPGTPDADVSALVALTRIDPAYVLVSPVPDQPAPVMATAWGLQLQADTGTDPRLAVFTRTYAAGGQGGEKGADCENGSTLEQARQALQAAGAV